MLFARNWFDGGYDAVHAILAFMATGASGTYQQSGPSAPQAARAVLAELPSQIGTLAMPAFINTSFPNPNSNLVIQARASGASAVTVAITPKPVNVAAPSGLAAAAVGSGGTFAAATYYWKITAINANGETTGSNEASVAVVANGSANLTWTAVPFATGYRIYRATAAGGENGATQLVASVGAVTSYTDTGTALQAGGVPAANTARTTQAVTVTTNGNAIVVNAPVDNSGNITATAVQVRDAINTDTNASPLVAAALSEGDGSGIVGTFASTGLSGNANIGSGVLGNAPLPSQHPSQNSYAQTRY